MRKVLLISLLLMAMSIELDAQSSTRSAVTTLDQPKVRLFPNPATTSLQVEWNASIKPASMVIVNGVTGKKMATGSISNGPLRINVSDYAPGIYVFRMFSADGNYLGGATFQVSK